ncbi:hypothetical protein [Chryseobacterium sp. 2987]|uniref:hypothetical protein n=2 Tax=Chryseobacterium TaxID=59732 RepID=UPI0012974998|nr:hypothetical protein [Chryseobacterium sp. 2987]
MIFLSVMKVDAQLFDWKKIYSGDLKAYRQYNIKTAVLKKNGEAINRIEILADKNEIITSNTTGTSWLIYDKQNRLSRILSKNTEYRVSYSDNGMIQSIEREYKNGYGIDILKNYRPDLNHPKNINYERNFLDIKTGKNEFYKKRFVFNSKDSLMSFNENLYEGGYYRSYQNGTIVRKMPREGGFEIDSSYYVSPNRLNGYHFIRNKERDSITKSQDSIYIETYFRGKIESKVVKHNDLLYNEELFIPDHVKNKYIYYTADDERYVLWEIRTTQANGRLKSKYPLKKYYDLIDGKLIRNKRKIKNEIIRMRGCGGGIPYKRLESRMAENAIFSPSVLFSKEVSRRASDQLDFFDVLSNEMEIFYNKMRSDESVKKEDYLGNNTSLSPGFYKFLTEFICREDYTVEITDGNGKTFIRRFFEHPDEFSIILNIFSKQE